MITEEFREKHQPHSWHKKPARWYELFRRLGQSEKNIWELYREMNDNRLTSDLRYQLNHPPRFKMGEFYNGVFVAFLRYRDKGYDYFVRDDNQPVPQNYECREEELKYTIGEYANKTEKERKALGQKYYLIHHKIKS